jgi:SAM-dependent methyltransferase
VSPRSHFGKGRPKKLSMNRSILGSIVDAGHRDSAERVRSLIERGQCAPSLFREELTRIPPAGRDRWVDQVFRLGAPPEDGPQLPVGCVPYLPCSVDALLRVAEHAPVHASDLFVDIGAGVGRAAGLVHLLTGAPAIGVEVQPALVAAARALAARLRLADLSFVEADASQSTDVWAAGSVFLLYCPFSGQRLARLLADLEAVARARPIRLCCVDLPLPPCPWLEPMPPASLDLTIYRSTFGTLLD